MQSLEELKANLAQYKTQAEQVQSLLALDPGNEQYKQLASDLADATRLTEQLIRAQSGGGASTTSREEEAPTEPLQLRKEPLAAAAAAAATAGTTEPWTPAVGCRVEAAYGDKRYPAVILALEGEKDAVIRWYGYEQVETKPVAELTPLRPPAGGELAPGQATLGFECEAVWVGDGQWYDAVVQGLVEHGFKVKFTRFGNEAEVPLEHLRPRTNTTATATAAAATATAAAGSAARPPKRPAPESQVKEFVIPDNLRLLPTDSEEDKARKRKKVKHLKAQWKERYAGALAAQAEASEAGGAGSWKDYLNRSKKKSATAKGLGALKKGSIFASPDTVDGRVGVVGSGQGTTEFERRKRNVMR